MAAVIDIPYKPRPLQAVIHAALDQFRWAVVVCHRRFGKTVCAVNQLQKGAVLCKKERPRFGYIAPTYAQGKAIAWDYLKHYSRPIPGVRTHESELRIDYPNKGQVRIYGADNPDSLRGLYFDGVVLDEYGLMRPNIFSEVIRPTLSDRQGWALFMGTPNGKNQFWEQVEEARERPADWFVAEYKASQTGYVTPDELASARASMTEDEYAQEYECSFEASVKGAVYARELQQARDDGRIAFVPYDPALPVDTNWDLGFRDATAIWFTQSAYAGRVAVIDYYENHGFGLDHYVQVVNQRPYVYGEHWLPHEANQKEFTTGKTMVETARVMLRPTVLAPPLLPVQDGIHAARMLLPKCWFDSKKCKQGLDALLNYKWQLNTRIDEYTHLPEHDWASHGADAFRTLAVRYSAPIKRELREAKRDAGEIEHARMLRNEYGYRPQRRGVGGRGGY